MKVHELFERLKEAMAVGYKDCDVTVNQDEHSLEIVDTNLYDLGPGLFQIEVE